MAENEIGPIIKSPSPHRMEGGEPRTTLSTNNDLLSLHIEEYIALRAEQRTRLDSANKIIHYYAILIGVIIAALITVYQESKTAFDEIFPLLLLLLPLFTIPFALTQQNEEILVRSIGSYFEKLKKKISEDGDFWKWEEHHIPKITEYEPQLITSLFRASLLISFSILSLILFLKLYGCFPGWHNECPVTISYQDILLIVDYFLVLLALRINIGMLNARWRQASEIRGENPPSKIKSIIGGLMHIILWFFYLRRIIPPTPKGNGAKLLETENSESVSEKD
jgi:hypothetical protein